MTTPDARRPTPDARRPTPDARRPTRGPVLLSKRGNFCRPSRPGTRFLSLVLSSPLPFACFATIRWTSTLQYRQRLFRTCGHTRA
jgi:hypothetical protein